MSGRCDVCLRSEDELDGLTCSECGPDEEEARLGECRAIVDYLRHGRVYLYGRKRAYPHYTAWTALADVTPGGAFESPSVVLDRMRRDK